MSWFWTNLIFWGSLIWLPWLEYAMLRNEAKPKKNIVVGVTLPYAAQADPAVKGLLENYKRELKHITWLTMLPVLPCLFVPRFGVGLTLLLTWTVAVCFVPNIPYIRCNRALARLKEERGWSRRTSLQAVADLKAAAVETRWISPLWFLPPFLLSLIPLCFERTLWWLWLMDAALVVLFYVCYRFLYRNRSEMADGDTDRTIALTRIRRYNWGKAWLVCAWAAGVFNAALWLTLDHIWLCLAVTLIYGLVVCLALVGVEFRVRRLQEKLTAGSGRDFYVDEDEYWIWGMFYYNPNDSHLLVNARVGINTTINLAKRSGQVITALILAVLLACPLAGIWTEVHLTEMERAPVELIVTETEIVASHNGSEYVVAFQNVESAELLTELPTLRRVAGTAMESAYTGSWKNDEWGRFTCCIDPRVGPWLLIETKDGGRCLFGGSTAGAAESAMEALLAN